MQDDSDASSSTKPTSSDVESGKHSGSEEGDSVERMIVIDLTDPASATATLSQETVRNRRQSGCIN